MQLQQIQWHVFQDMNQLREMACAAIVETANRAIAERGEFSIVLAGGSTPHDVYRLLRTAQTDWSKWQVYYGDERCLPPEHAERNSRMAEDSLLNHVPIPQKNVHPMPAELGPVESAQRYSQLLADVGAFDLVLLGMGEDAHTASLFPGHVWESVPPTPAIPVRNAPKPPADRVSLSASRLSNARRVIFLVTGAGKREAVAEWREAAPVPVAAIRPSVGVEVFLDAAADTVPA